MLFSVPLLTRAACEYVCKAISFIYRWIDYNEQQQQPNVHTIQFLPFTSALSRWGSVCMSNEYSLNGRIHAIHRFGQISHQKKIQHSFALIQWNCNKLQKFIILHPLWSTSWGKCYKFHSEKRRQSGHPLDCIFSNRFFSAFLVSYASFPLQFFFWWYPHDSSKKVPRLHCN